jgi:hypothetical protein
MPKGGCIMGTIDDRLNSLKESIKAAIENCVSLQEQEIREGHNAGKEEAFYYVLEMIDKHSVSLPITNEMKVHCPCLNCGKSSIEDLKLTIKDLSKIIADGIPSWRVGRKS